MAVSLAQTKYPNLIGKVFFIEPFEPIENCNLEAGKKYIPVFVEDNTVWLHGVDEDRFDGYVPNKNEIYQAPVDFPQFQQTENILAEFQVSFHFQLKKKKRMPVLNVNQILESMIGKLHTVEESEIFTQHINYHLKSENTHFTTKELITIYRLRPLEFARLRYIPEEAKDIAIIFKDELAGMSQEEKDSITEDYFDFTIEEKQIKTGHRLVKDFHGGTMHRNQVIDVLCSDNMLYFESKDSYSISDTYPREVFFEIASTRNYLEF